MNHDLYEALMAERYGPAIATEAERPGMWRDDQGGPDTPRAIRRRRAVLLSADELGEEKLAALPAIDEAA